MTKTIFPQTESKNWIQQNKGDLYPVLYSTRNINLEKRGYIGLSRRMSYLKKDSGLATTVISMSIQSNLAKYKWLSAGGNMYDSSYNFQTIAQDSDASALTVYSDATNYNGKFWYTNSSANIFYRTGSGAYTTLGMSLSPVQHPMAVFTNKNLLCVGDLNTVKTVDSSGTVNTSALVLPSEYYVTGLKYLNNKMYVATVNQAGGRALLFEWDGANATSAFGYETGARTILCMEVYQESIVLMNSRGELLRFGGGGFTQLATLPFFQEKDYSWYTNISYQTVSRGMVVIDEYLYINITNALTKNNALDILPEFVAGIYQYHKDFGLVHKFSPSQSLSSAITDFGQNYSITPSAIFPLIEDIISYPNSPVLANGSRFMSGGNLIDATLATSVYLQSITSGESRGDFVTSKIYTGDIINVNQKLYVKFKNLLNSTDKIIVKYRSLERPSLPIKLLPDVTNAVTWTSTTTFTSTNSQMANALRGDEVFVTTGNGGGSLAHISNIEFSGGTYTVTLDEAIVGVSNGNRSGVIINNWSKLGVILNTNTDGFQEFPVGINGKYFQLKIELRGENEPMIEEITLLSAPQIPAK